MDLKSMKFVAMFILFALSVVFTSIPLLISLIVNRISKRKQVKLIGQQRNNLNRSLKKRFRCFCSYTLLSSYISCFAGGVFLGTSMLDLVPDAVANMKIIQSLMFESNSTSFKPDSILGMSHSMSTGDASMDAQMSQSMTNQSFQDTFRNRVKRFPLAEFLIVVGILLIMLVEQLILFFKESSTKLAEPSSQKIAFYKNVDQVHEEIRDKQIGESEAICLIDESQNQDEPTIMNDAQTDVERLIESNKITSRSIMLLIALCVHSIFEGLSIGLQTNKKILYNLISAISIHKSVIAFSLSQQFVQSLNKLNQFGFVKKRTSSANEHLGSFYFFVLVKNILFSISNPVGIFIAIILVHVYPDMISTLFISFIKCVSCGTFIYITFFEILPNELSNPIGNRLLKVFFISFGFMFLSAIILMN